MAQSMTVEGVRPPDAFSGAAEGTIWVLADPRAGTAAQALGLAERLNRPFRSVPLDWSPLARLPWPLPTLAGLTPGTRGLVEGAEVPALVLSAGRRAAPVALWLRRRGAKLVHCMRPGFGASHFERLVLGRHDLPDDRVLPPSIIPILGATHRFSPDRLEAARQRWSPLADLPRPRVALLLGGPVRGEGLSPVAVHNIIAPVAGFVRASGGSILASSSRRTGSAGAAAMAGSLRELPGRVFQWGDAGENPYAGFLAWADLVVVTGDSVSMLSEALVTAAPVFVAPVDGARRHQRLHDTLFKAGEARPLAVGLDHFHRIPLDETARVAALLHETGLVPAG